MHSCGALSLVAHGPPSPSFPLCPLSHVGDVHDLAVAHKAGPGGGGLLHALLHARRPVARALGALAGVGGGERRADQRGAVGVRLVLLLDEGVELVDAGGPGGRQRPVLCACACACAFWCCKAGGFFLGGGGGRAMEEVRVAWRRRSAAAAAAACCLVGARTRRSRTRSPQKTHALSLSPTRS